MQRSCSVPGHGAPKSDKYPSSQRTKSLGETDAQRDLQSRTRPCRAGEPHWVLWGPGQRPGGSHMGLQSCILRARYAGERWGAGSGDAARAEPGLKKSQSPARAAPSSPRLAAAAAPPTQGSARVHHSTQRRQPFMQGDTAGVPLPQISLHLPLAQLGLWSSGPPGTGLPALSTMPSAGGGVAGERRP